MIKTIIRNNKYVLLNFFEYLKFKEKNIEELSLLSRNEVYTYFHNYFYFSSLNAVRKHRFYFKIENRGFGEDAFHSMWEILLKTFKPKNILEIGVYRGQTISLFSLLSNKFNLKSSVWGITPLNTAADSVSNYEDLDYEIDISYHYDYFNLGKANLIKAYSNEKESVDFINSKIWDLVYIDGSHDYEIVKLDVLNSLRNLNKNGLLALDDSSLYQEFDTDQIKNKAFKGHPGPSKVCSELMKSEEISLLFGVGHINIFIKK